ncbi:MAG: methyltransferase domain-containing protein [Planctomycetes bacterium]|nr:methyltransferase domain-containing protein [Planctomycetota bacterium]
MPWYDSFSNIYDYSVELVYKKYRSKVVDKLNVQPDAVVLDLACGTGPNHPHLVERMSGEGLIVAVDYSAGMIERARKKAQQKGWDNIVFIQQDACKLTLQDIENAVGHAVQINHVIVTLGLSVIPNWQDVFASTFDLLSPGGSYVIFDIHTTRWVPQTWLVKMAAQADTYRQTWKALDACSDEFEFEYLPGSAHVHGGQPFIAVGKRPRSI